MKTTLDKFAEALKSIKGLGISIDVFRKIWNNAYEVGAERMRNKSAFVCDEIARGVANGYLASKCAVEIRSLPLVEELEKFNPVAQEDKQPVIRWRWTVKSFLGEYSDTENYYSEQEIALKIGTSAIIRRIEESRLECFDE
jgi:hypothetical protein